MIKNLGEIIKIMAGNTPRQNFSSGSFTDTFI